MAHMAHSTHSSLTWLLSALHRGPPLSPGTKALLSAMVIGEPCEPSELSEAREPCESSELKLSQVSQE